MGMTVALYVCMYMGVGMCVGSGVQACLCAYSSSFPYHSLPVLQFLAQIHAPHKVILDFSRGATTLDISFL